MIAKLTIAAVAAGLLATGGASTGFATPTAAKTPALTAFGTAMTFGEPHGNPPGGGGWGPGSNDNRTPGGGGWGPGGEHGWGWNSDRRGNGDWDGHDWHWWHDSGISPELCRHGGGDVQWDRHRCQGGRFDDFRVR